MQWVFLPSPGVDKGTYASRLSKLLGAPQIATGQIKYLSKYWQTYNVWIRIEGAALYAGVLIGEGRMAVFGEWEQVRAEIMQERKKLELFFDHEREKYKLEVIFVDILASFSCCLGGVESNTILLQNFELLQNIHLFSNIVSPSKAIEHECFVDGDTSSLWHIAKAIHNLEVQFLIYLMLKYAMEIQHIRSTLLLNAFQEPKKMTLYLDKAVMKVQPEKASGKTGIIT
ncbi:hypothetical protein Cni_G09897 [Canna indica]|uniref:RDR1/2-like PH-like domain-containing protein n=1 Tax=Canna indica TaxID=4628 RepID=A0AAQ3Q9U9_9LILI|nr:hypothetical protein Cni_G09897 [Canna indica]